LQEGGAATVSLALTAFLLMALAAAGTLRLLAAGVRRR
jgi:hypothetical protein